jgi:hypothetical protein
MEATKKIEGRYPPLPNSCLSLSLKMAASHQIEERMAHSSSVTRYSPNLVYLLDSDAILCMNRLNSELRYTGRPEPRCKGGLPWETGREGYLDREPGRGRRGLGRRSSRCDALAVSFAGTAASRVRLYPAEQPPPKHFLLQIRQDPAVRSPPEPSILLQPI